MLVSLQFAQPRVFCSCSSTWKGKSRMSWQNRWETRSSSKLQGQKMLSEGRFRRIHTHTLYILPAFMDVSRHRYPFVILIPHFFFVFFFLPLDTNRLRGESSFRPEPLRKPPYEPSRVDIQFYYNFKKIYTDIPLELPKDDQVLLLHSFNDVLSLKRDDGKGLSSTSENLKKKSSPDQKSRCRTCVQACHSPFKADGSTEIDLQLLHQINNLFQLNLRNK